MGIGRKVDTLAGNLSRVLHGLRGPKDNTLEDLSRYLDHSTAEFFPEPPPLEHVEERRSVVSKLLRTTTLTWQSSHVVWCPNYRIRHERDYASNQTVVARWLRPDGHRREECLLYVHGWLEPGSWVEETFLFPSWTRELEVDVLHVALPFHGPRNPRSAFFSGEYFWTADLVRSLEGVRQAVCDLRAAMGWLRRQGYERVGVAGISLGGALAMLLACVEPLPDYMIAIVAHVMLGEAVENATIMWRVKHDLERWGKGTDERRRIFDRIGLDGAMPLLPASRQLWIEARDDGHIDRALVMKQWDAWGRPGLHFIPGGHMTFPLHLPEITRTMRTFLEEQVRRST